MSALRAERGRGDLPLSAILQIGEPYSPLAPPAEQCEASTALPKHRERVADRRAAKRSWRWLDAGVALSTLCVVLMLVNGLHHAVPLTDFLAVRVTIKNILLLIVFCAGWEVSFRALGLYDDRLVHAGIAALPNMAVA